MPDLATLQTWRDEAIAARHALMMTGQITEIWRDGRRITYSRAKPSELEDYIRWLENEIAKALDEQNGTSTARRRPFRPIFTG